MNLNIASIITNIFLTAFNILQIGNDLKSYNYNLKPAIKLVPLNIETTFFSILQTNYIILKYKIINKGTFSINNICLKFNTLIFEIEGSPITKKYDLLASNEEIEDELFVEFDNSVLYESVKKFLSEQEEGIIGSTYSFILNSEINFENIDDKKYLKKYIFDLNLALNGRLIDEILKIISEEKSIGLPLQTEYKESKLTNIK